MKAIKMVTENCENDERKLHMFLSEWHKGLQVN